VFDASLNIGLRSAHVMSTLVAPLMVKNKTGIAGLFAGAQNYSEK